MNKPKLWTGGNLDGEWEVTLKLDGVRVIKKESGAFSRSDKPLYNVPDTLPVGDYECFADSWENTVHLLRTQKGLPTIDERHFFSLDPICSALIHSTLSNPKASLITELMENVVASGLEGLVLRQGDRWLKVKPTETYDVPVIGLKDGKGRNEGRLGAFITPMGNVGVGLTDVQREEYNTLLIGTIIEVSCMSLTPNGKFRHPRFIRVRHDK